MAQRQSFKDRREAGKRLAEKLDHYANRDDVLILGLPRGGVPVAYEVAVELNLPLDVFLVRKLGTPGHEEMAMGAIATGGVRVLNREVVENMGISSEKIDEAEEKERKELRRREEKYRGDYPDPEIKGKTVLLVDDGLATGATMRAAVQALKESNPAKIVVAVPTASPEVCDSFRAKVDEIICAMQPQPFRAVGMWYDDFSQTTDEEVRDLLEKAKARDGISAW